MPGLDDFLILADRCGVFVFSLSGAIVAIRSRMDILGVMMLALLPAVGGGTLRDVLLDAPIFWLSDSWSIGIGLLGGLTTYWLYPVIADLRPLRWADALGLALFAATGAAKTEALGFAPHVIIMMSAMTAAFGGVMRDIVANQVPLLFREDVYVAAALVGGVAYWLLVRQAGFDTDVALLLSAGLVFIVRVGAIRYGWQLPRR